MHKNPAVFLATPGEIWYTDYNMGCVLSLFACRSGTGAEKQAERKLAMKESRFLKNKFYLILLGAWVFLYLLQAILGLCGVLNGILAYILAVAYGISVAAMLAVSYGKRESVFLVICGVSSFLQVLLFLLQIPNFVTGQGGVPQTILWLFYIPGAALLQGNPWWHWGAVAFWGVIFCGTVEVLWKMLCGFVSAWWEERKANRS